MKNLQRVGGQTLLARAIVAAQAARLVTDVVVSTDHLRIRQEARRFGATVVDRPEELSGSVASSESALLHALDTIPTRDGSPADPDVTILLQCTSPFIDSHDLDTAVERVLSGAEDAVFSAAANHSFLWAEHDGAATAVGHDAGHRPRRQDREPQYRETGAFYVMRTSGLRTHQHRFFGRIGLAQVPEETAIEIDSPTDLDMARAMDQGRGSDWPIAVDALVTDFDGVHTDDQALIDADGTEHVRVSRRDGMGVARLRTAGVPQLILSTEANPVVTARATKLRIEVRQNLDDKASALQAWLAGRRLDPARAAFVGNDVNDLAAMRSVGWPIAVADAHPDVLAAARVVLTASGGNGAVREACERVLAARPAAVPSATPAVTAQQNLQSVPDLPVRTTSTTKSTRKGNDMSITTTNSPAASIGDVEIGAGRPVYMIGEIGINHNGDVEIAKQLIDVAAQAGAQAVKFQKRTPEISTPDDMKDKPRSTPWGEMTYLDYKHRMEFGRADYEKLISHAANLGLHCFASPWDIPSVHFMEEMGAVTHKVASASVTDLELLRTLEQTGKPIILSTGMSTIEQIDTAVETLGTSNLVLLHSTSTYPLPPEEANLRTIATLQQRYGVPVGYSGHERGLQISLAAVALGAVAVERHITLDRTMWGSDQASSLEPTGLEHLIRDIRILEEAMGDGEKRVFPGELAPLSRLRRVDA